MLLIWCHHEQRKCCVSFISTFRGLTVDCVMKKPRVAMWSCRGSFVDVVGVLKPHPPQHPIPTLALCVRKRWSFSVLSVVVVFWWRSKHADGSNRILFVLTRQNGEHSFLTWSKLKKVQKNTYLLWHRHNKCVLVIINKHSFEPFYVWILFRMLAVIVFQIYFVKKIKSKTLFWQFCYFE